MRLTVEQTRDWDMEVINPVLFERNKDRPIPDVLDELKQTYEKLLAKLDSISFEDLLKPRHPDDFTKRPLHFYFSSSPPASLSPPRSGIAFSISSGL